MIWLGQKHTYIFIKVELSIPGLASMVPMVGAANIRMVYRNYSSRS